MQNRGVETSASLQIISSPSTLARELFFIFYHNSYDTKHC